MAATPQFTRLIGVVTPVANPRLTKLIGLTSGTVGVRLTKLSGQTVKAARVQLTSLSGRTAIAVGAPTVTPPSGLDVVAGALLTLTAGVTLHPPATAVTQITWRLVARESGAKLPTFLATASLSVQVYLPVEAVNRSWTFGVTVKDDAGRTSAEGLVVITSHAADYLAAAAGGWVEPMQNSFASAPDNLWT